MYIYFPISPFQKAISIKNKQKTHIYIYMSLPFFVLVGFSGCEGIIRCCPWLAPGMWYFIYMFRVRLRRLVQKLIAKRKPKKVVICTSEVYLDMWNKWQEDEEDLKSNDWFYMILYGFYWKSMRIGEVWMVCEPQVCPMFFLFKVLHLSCPGMLYFLDEKPGDGWADGTLRALGYNSNPGKLQAVAGFPHHEISGKFDFEFFGW